MKHKTKQLILKLMKIHNYIRIKLKDMFVWEINYQGLYILFYKIDIKQYKQKIIFN